MLTLKMDPISFVALTSIIQRRLLVLPSELMALTSGSFLFLNCIIGNSNDENYTKLIAFYKTHSSLGLAISTAYNGSYMSVANDYSTLEYPDYRFPSSKSNCTILNKWHVISVTWSNRKNLSNC